MKIAVRLDDITPDMDWDKFRRFECLLDQYRVAPLVGIVPDNQDDNLSRNPKAEDFSEQVQQWKEKGWQVAMHGWHHIYTTSRGGLFPLNHFSEFAGISKEKQQTMIREGKELLQKQGIETDIFMAPAHSYDKNTLQVLKEEGFRYITDGFGENPYIWKGLTFLPIAFMKNKDIRKKNGYTTLVFHTNTMTEQEFESFEKVLEEHKADFISYGDYLKVTPVTQNILGRMKEYAMASLKHFLVSVRS